MHTYNYCIFLVDYPIITIQCPSLTTVTIFDLVSILSDINIAVLISLAQYAPERSFSILLLLAYMSA